MVKPFKYVSDIDQFLSEFDQSHPQKSPSQQKEITKNARIARLRDSVSPKKEPAKDKKLWEGF